ncbi:hypothetical protein GCM10010273_16010 [Streptomyces lavendulocolor]
MLTLPMRNRARVSMAAPDTRSLTPAVRTWTPSGPVNRAIAPGAPLVIAALRAPATPSMSGAGTGVGVAARVTAGAEGTVGAEGSAWAEVAGATPATTAAIRVAPAARRRCGDTVT